MRRLCEAGLLAAAEAGAEYADVRVVDARWQTVRTLSGELIGVDRGAELGMGVRVYIGGAWGFASAAEASTSVAQMLGRRAAELAESSRLLLTHPVELAAVEPVRGEWRTPVRVDPFTVPIDEQRDLLLSVEEALRGAPAVRAMAGRIAASKQLVWLATSEGGYALRDRVVTGAGYRAMAETPEGRSYRSWPQAFGGQFGAGGWEVVEALDLLGSAVRVGDEITRLIHSPRCPEERVDVILTGAAVARLLPATLGRCFEGDRLGLGSTGRSGTFVTREELGGRALASPVISVASDPGLAGGLGGDGFDDEGVAGERGLLIDRGRWVGVLADRQTATRLGEAARPGSARAGGFNRAPLVRLGNLVLLGGDGDVDRLVGGIDRGLLVDTPVRITTDEAGRRFVCELELAWTIRGGRRWEMVRHPTIVGDTESFWSACDAVAAADDRVWSVQEVERGVPSQSVAVSVAAPAARFRGVVTAPAGRA